MAVLAVGLRDASRDVRQALAHPDGRVVATANS